MRRLMGPADEETRRLTKILDHPVRARIIELLGARGALGWKELSLEVGVKTGALYHHLDALEGLVDRDSEKRYVLTKSGRVVYSHVVQSNTPDAVHRAALDLKEAGRARRALAAAFAPRSLLARLMESRRTASAVLVLLGSAFVAFDVLTGGSPSLYYMRASGDQVQAAGGFLGSLAVLLVVSYASSRLIFRSPADPLALAAASAFSFLPVVAFSAVTLVPQVSAFLSSTRVLYTAFLVIFQTWSATLLGAGISVATGARIEKTLLVSLMVLYATMVLLFVQGKAF